MRYKKNIIGLFLLLIAFVLFAFALVSINSQWSLTTAPNAGLVVESKMGKMVETALDGDDQMLMDDFSGLSVSTKETMVAKRWHLPKEKVDIIDIQGYAWSD